MTNTESSSDPEKAERERLLKRTAELNQDEDFIAKLKDVAAAGKIALKANARIRLRFFLFRLNDISIFAVDVVRALRIASPDITRDRQIGAVRLLLENFDEIMPGVSSEQRKEITARFFGEMEAATLQKLSQYEKWACNQALIALFTVLETFFEEAVDAILIIEPKYLSEKTVTIREVLNPEGKSVVDDVRSKTVKAFAAEGLAKKFEFLENRLSMNKSDIFDWSLKTPEGARQLQNYDYNKLMSLNDNRNDVVHRDLMPISDIEELCGVANFFQSIVLNVTHLSARKFKVAIDFGFPPGAFSSV